MTSLLLDTQVSYKQQKLFYLKIAIKGRAIYGNLENKINTLYWPVENSICQVTTALCNLLLHNLTLWWSETGGPSENHRPVASH